MARRRENFNAPRRNNSDALRSVRALTLLWQSDSQSPPTYIYIHTPDEITQSYLHSAFLFTFLIFYECIYSYNLIYIYSLRDVPSFTPWNHLGDATKYLLLAYTAGYSYVYSCLCICEFTRMEYNAFQVKSTNRIVSFIILNFNSNKTLFTNQEKLLSLISSPTSRNIEKWSRTLTLFRDIGEIIESRGSVDHWSTFQLYFLSLEKFFTLVIMKKKNQRPIS